MATKEELAKKAAELKIENADKLSKDDLEKAIDKAEKEAKKAVKAEELAKKAAEPVAKSFNIYGQPRTTATPKAPSGKSVRISSIARKK